MLRCFLTTPHRLISSFTLLKLSKLPLSFLLGRKKNPKTAYNIWAAATMTPMKDKAFNVSAHSWLSTVCSGENRTLLTILWQKNQELFGINLGRTISNRQHFSYGIPLLKVEYLFQYPNIWRNFFGFISTCTIWNSKPFFPNFSVEYSKLSVSRKKQEKKPNEQTNRIFDWMDS